jgi:hypothetical protein
MRMNGWAMVVVPPVSGALERISDLQQAGVVQNSPSSVSS